MKKVILILILLSCMLPAEVPAGTNPDPGPNDTGGEKKSAAGIKKSSGKKRTSKGEAAKIPAAVKQATEEKKTGTEPGATAVAPAPVTPANESTVEHGIVGFTWTRSSGTRTPAYQIEVSYNPDFTSPVISTSTQTASYVTKTALTAGTYYWRVKETSARKQAKAWSPAWRFTVPVAAPLNTMTDYFINKGMVSTNSATVSLALSAKSENEITAYAITESPEVPQAGGPQWIAVTPAKQYASVVPYTLSSGEGVKTLFVWFKDIAGKVSAKKSGAITFDTTPPRTAITSQPDDTLDSTMAIFRFTSSEPGAKFRCSLDGGAFEVCTNPASYAGLAKGRHTFAVRSIDAAGNVDPTPAQYAWLVNVMVRNTTPPQFINGGASFTDRNPVHLTLSAYSAFKENINGYYISEQPAIPSALAPGWVTFREVKAFTRKVEYTMSEGTGRKVLYVWFKDSDGNVSDVQSDTIERVNSNYLVVLLVLVQLVIIL
jgi:hypothetical protein